MLKIINKNVVIIFICIFFVILLVLGILRITKKNQPSGPITNSGSSETLPIPTYIPAPHIISDATQSSKIVLEWNVDETTTIPAASKFYSVSSVKMSLEKAKSIALLLGFTKQPQALGEQDTILVWENFGKNLHIYINSGYVLYSSSQVKGKSDIDGKKQDGVNSVEEALSIANDFIKPLNLSSESHVVTHEQTVLIDSEGKILPTEKNPNDYFYQLTYSYRIGNYPISLQRANDQVIKIIIDRLGTVKQLQYWDINPIPSKDSISLVSLSTIKDTLDKENYTYTFTNPEDITNPPQLDTISISSINFMYLYDFTSPYLFPVFILSGQGKSAKGIFPVTIPVSALMDN